MAKRCRAEAMLDDDAHGRCDAPLEQLKRVSASALPTYRSSGDAATNERSFDRSHAERFATHGYAVVPHVLSPQELHVLQTESALLYDRAYAAASRDTSTSDLALEQMREDAAARVNAAAYLDARTHAVATTCGASSTASATRETMETLLFGKLPAYAKALLQTSDTSSTSTSSTSTSTTSHTNERAPLDDRQAQTTDASDLLFFNEHYVVKPPRTDVAFRWHRDDDEQLAMCVHRATIAPYVSVWCALDDVTLANGPLRFVSQAHALETADDVAALDARASSPVVAAAGTAVFFRSDVWHCSSSNASDALRRAFYAQYSTSRITASPADPSPLSFAIPCRP